VAADRRAVSDGVSESFSDELTDDFTETEAMAADEVPEPGRVEQTTELKSGSSNQAFVRQFRLRVIDGPDAGASFESSGDRVVIGKHPSANLVLGDRAVSRFHCAINVVDGRPVIRDLNSRNGTLVDGMSVVMAYPRNGATIAIGRTRLSFDLGDDHVPVPLSPHDRFGRMRGRSHAMRAVFATLQLAAEADATVLIEGETGTGKELAAESIHLNSARKDGPFIIVDCSAIPRDLLESELFGHEKGAFTGATHAREGAFAAASGGTVFLDEIGELGPDLQPKLLRVLERRHVKPVGSNRHQEVDVRVIAATNRDLRAEVNARRFRSDLYYRLAVVEVRLPALREHPEDIPMLVEEIAEQLAVGAEGAELVRSPEFLAGLSRHSWPGNVRELRNYIERCLALRRALPHNPGGDDHEAELVDPSIPLKVARERWTEILERRYLQALMDAHGDNVSSAARAAEIGRVYLYRLLWRHGLRDKSSG
jgi:two-component system, NtrC family, response regulator GlrR